MYTCINNKKLLKIDFQKHKHEFNLETHIIVLHNANNRFTTVYLNLTIDFLIEQFHTKPTFFQKLCKKYENSRSKFLPKTVFRSLLFNVFTEYSS